MSKPWPCAPDGDQPVDHVLGQRLAGVVVHGVVGEHLGPARPHLVDLGGELHEVARHARCRAAAGSTTSENRPCRACPNSWKAVRTSSVVISVGRPAGGLGTLRLTTTTGRCRAGATGRRTRPSTRLRAWWAGRTSRTTNSPSVLPSASSTSKTRTSAVVDRQVLALGEGDAVELRRRRRRCRPASTRWSSKYGRRAALSTSYVAARSCAA